MALFPEPHQSAIADNTVIEEIVVYGKVPDDPTASKEITISVLTIPEFKLGPCNIMPTKQDIANSLMKLASIPGKLEVLAMAMVNEELEQASEDLQAILDELEGLLGPCAPNWETIDIPERKWEVIVDCLIREYPMFVINKILELINKIISVDFEIPLPPLPIKIDILKLLTDPEYKKELKAKFAGVDDAMKELIKGKIDELKSTFDGDEESLQQEIADLIDNEKLAVIDALYDLLPPEAKAFGGEFGTEITEFKAEALWAWIQIQMSSSGTGLLMALFDILISKFDKIWKALGLPDLPIPLTLDIGAMVKAIVDAEKASFLAEVDKIKDDIDDFDKVELIDQLTESMTGSMIEQLEAIKIGPFSLADFCGGIDEDFVCSENKMRRCKESLAELKANYQLWLMKKWMEIVSSFLEAIGLAAIMDMVTFDFCDFLKLMGVPEKISPPDLLMGLGMIAVGGDRKSVSDRVGDSAKFKFTTEETTVMNAANAMPRFTASANQTTFTGADNNNNTLSYTAGLTTAFKSGVSLEDYVIDETNGDKLLLEDGEDIVFEVSSQYTATNGSSLVLTDAADEGDIIFIVPQAV